MSLEHLFECESAHHTRQRMVARLTAANDGFMGTRRCVGAASEHAESGQFRVEGTRRYTSPVPRSSRGLLAVLLALTACGGGPPTSSPSSDSPPAAAMPDAPFDGDNVDKLGLQPGDVPGADYAFGPDAPDGKLPDPAWGAHLKEHGFQGRWWADLSGDGMFVSRASPFGLARGRQVRQWPTRVSGPTG